MAKKIAYIEEMKKIIRKVEDNEIEAIDQAAEILCNTIQNKHMIYVFGASHAGMLTIESFYRSGGMVTIHPILPRELDINNRPITITSAMENLHGYGTILGQKTAMKEGDVLIVHSVSGRNPVTIELTEYALSKKVTVIAITNLAYSKQVTSKSLSNKKLYEIADLVMDNHGCYGDAAVEIPDHSIKVGASSTVIGALIINSIYTETILKLAHAGIEVLPVFYSANTDEGKEKNQQVYEVYKDQIDYEF